ncbi:hypothetical protein DSM112329_04769 [Paraconexibacter sp. AEG42_29]|uniref:RNA polymerase sigma-70 region 4 domain-containing protein n=1 Tax=Paraconexibacter sp. AEG42_29 TaxID=2997339 RepID=A0AAU7B2H6_9ACTN
MDDEDLVAYMASAKRAGATDHGTLAAHMLLWRHEPRMRGWVRAGLPEHLQHLSPAVEDWVLKQVLHSALKLPLKGEHAGEWVNWCKTVVKRQTISFFRSAQGKALELERQLPGEHVDADGRTTGKPLSVDFNIDDLAAGMDYGAATDAALAGLSEQHRRVVHAAYIEDRASKDVAAEFGETVANVDQIKKRFKEALRAELVARGVWQA